MIIPSLRCSAASVERAEAPAGTASTVRAFLLLEHSGSWGIDALRDARLPDGLGAALSRAARETGVRILLIRRPGGRAGEPLGSAPIQRQVFAAHADPIRPQLAAGSVTDARDLLDLDLAALAAGGASGLPASDEQVFAVCTHGRHDACCAERGRPVALALAVSHPEQTWEVSHIGGDRFAGNMLVLPHGLYYGRLDPDTAVAVADRQLAGELELDHLRGRSGFAMPVQAAEIALRRQLDEVGEGAVRLTARSREGDTTRAVFVVGGTSYAVRVRSTPSADVHQLTCRASSQHPAQEHEILEIGRAST